MKSKEEQILAEINNLVTSSHLSDAFDSFCDLVAEVIPAETIAISSVDLNSRTYTPVHRWGRPNERFRLNVPRSLVGTTIDTLQTSTTGYIVSSEQRETVVERTNITHDDPFIDLLGWIVSPLVSDEQLVGAVQVRTKNANAYTKAHIETLDRISHALARPFSGWSRLRNAERETEVLTVLATIGRLSNSSLDLSDSYSEIAGAISEVIPFNRVRVKTFSVDHSSTTTEFDSSRSQSPQSRPTPISYFELIDTLDTLRVSVITEESTTETNSSQSNLTSPLIWNNNLIGIIEYESDQIEIYGIDHQRFADLVADQLSGAIANNRRYRIEQRRSRINTALDRIAITAAGSNNLEELFAAIATELEKFLQFDRFAGVLYDRTSRKLSLAHVSGITLPGEKIGDDISNPNGPPTWDRYIEEYRNEEPTERDQALADLGLKSWLQAPIGMQSEGPDGVISLRSLQENQYSNEDYDLLAQIARQLTPAIQNTLLSMQREVMAEQRQLAEKLDAENVELQRIADERSEFLSTVSHELRTPLTSISAFSDILARNRTGKLDTRDLKQIEAIRRSTATLTDLIDDLIDLSRADTGNLNIVPTSFELDPLIAEVIEVSQYQLTSKNQILTISPLETGAWLRADRTRLSQVLNNLISNASKYSPDQSTINLQIGLNDYEISMQISDNGIGIAEQDLPHVFTPFFRSSTIEAQAVEGTGLGLAVVEQLVNQHAGKIDIESEPGEGTTVTVQLPCLIPTPTTIPK